MDNESKLFFGKILGEIYRIQNNSEDMACPAEPSQIFGLLNGFENVIDEEIERIGAVSREELYAVMDVLDEYWRDLEKRQEFKGFYDIEHKLQQRGIGRGKAIPILTYLKANHQFVELIDKMNSQHSPIECKNFDLDEFEK
nr:hypothetical protein [uncultured Carboxylicivirga sp.]